MCHLLITVAEALGLPCSEVSDTDSGVTKCNNAMHAHDCHGLCHVTSKGFRVAQSTASFFQTSFLNTVHIPGRRQASQATDLGLDSEAKASKGEA